MVLSASSRSWWPMSSNSRILALLAASEDWGRTEERRYRRKASNQLCFAMTHTTCCFSRQGLTALYHLSYCLLLFQPLPLTLRKVLLFFQLTCLRTMKAGMKVSPIHSRPGFLTNSVRGRQHPILPHQNLHLAEVLPPLPLLTLPKPGELLAAAVL